MILLAGGELYLTLYVCVVWGGVGVDEQMEAEEMGEVVPPNPRPIFRKNENHLDSSIKMLLYLYPTQ